jgi:hypothetical protein
MNKKERVDKLKKLQAAPGGNSSYGTKITKIYSSNKKKKEDLQRKILVGSYYLEQAKNKNVAQELQKIMLSYLQKDSDKNYLSKLNNNFAQLVVH